MYEFEDWLRDCYTNKEISEEEIKVALQYHRLRLQLWDDYVRSFTNDEKDFTVKQVIKDFLH